MPPIPCTFAAIPRRRQAQRFTSRSGGPAADAELLRAVFLAGALSILNEVAGTARPLSA